MLEGGRRGHQGWSSLVLRGFMVEGTVSILGTLGVCSLCPKSSPGLESLTWMCPPRGLQLDFISQEPRER